MTTKHTPGPWEIDDADFPVIITHCERDEAKVVCTVECSEMPHGQNQYGKKKALSNARLIALAPESVKVVRNLLTYIEAHIAGGGKCLNAADWDREMAYAKMVAAVETGHSLGSLHTYRADLFAARALLAKVEGRE